VADTLMFVCSDADRYVRYAAPFREAGWDTRTVAPDAADTLSVIEAASPIATVFDLDAGHGEAVRTLVAALLADPDVSRPLLVFVGGDEALVGTIKADIPFGVFVKPDELAWVLKRLIYKQ